MEAEMVVELYPHQLKALRELHNGAILKGGVGTGKSMTAMAYFVLKECKGLQKINGVGDYKPMKDPKDIYIFTTAKKRNDLDWEIEANRFGIGTDPELSLDGVKLTVDSWNNIIKYSEIKDAFVIFDEQRLVGSGAWVKAFYKIARNNRWIVLSATPGDVWMDYCPIFVANGLYRNKSDFVEQHVVYDPYAKFPKIKNYVGQAVLSKHRRSIIVDMPYLRHTKRHVSLQLVDYDKAKYDDATKRRWNIFEEAPLRDAGDLCRVQRRIVNQDISRLALIMKLHEDHKKLIIFYNFDYELETLRTLAGTLEIPVAEWNGHKHQGIPDTDRWVYLVQYTAGAEGWNCIETDAMVFYSLTYSYKIFEQAQGRIDRLNTPFVDLSYYVLRSRASIDMSIWKAIITKKSFNEKTYVKSSYDLVA